MHDARLAAINVGASTAEILCVEATWHRLIQRRSATQLARESRSFLQRHAIFNALPTFAFEKLSRVTRMRVCGKDCVGYATDDDDGAAIIILVGGEFHLRSHPHGVPDAIFGNKL